MSSASYLPVVETMGSKSGEGPLSPRTDPLYAALLSGDIGSTTGARDSNEPLNTLDEPVSETIKRDLDMIWTKGKTVLSLRDPQSSLSDWDLWGPLVNSLLLAFSGAVLATGTVSAFTTIFTLIWLGAPLISINARLLGYRLPLLPAIAYLGYCLGPLAAAGALLIVSPAFWVIRLLLLGVGAGWAAVAALRLLEIEPALEDRRLLAAFPFCLYFSILFWIMMVIN